MSTIRLRIARTRCVHTWPCLFAEREVWYEAATRAIEARIRAAASSSVSGTTPPAGVARGVVLFVGDGMGMSTLTAARILSGQRHGNPGEEAQLAWDSFPAVALARVSARTKFFFPFLVLLFTFFFPSSSVHSVCAVAVTSHVKPTLYVHQISRERLARDTQIVDSALT